jgi:protein-S-isoprenylcysteine O-methyltransferase Ste14
MRFSAMHEVAEESNDRPEDCAAAPLAAGVRGGTLTGVLWAGAAALAVGLAGGFAWPAVWILAAVSAIVFRSLGQRGQEERPRVTDALGLFLQLAFLVLLCGAAYDHRNDGSEARFGWGEVVGLALVGAGGWLRQRSAAALGPQFTVHLRVGPDHRLVQSGPYRIVRHPNYAGLLLVAFGTAIAFSSPLAAIAATFLWLPAMLARVAQEERLLVRTLGAEYEGYARTTWRLIPGLY